MSTQPHVDRPHLLQAKLMRIICGKAECVQRLESTNLRNLQSLADIQWPDGRVDVRDEYTSDMTYHGAGNGRLVAQRIHGKWSVP